MDEQESRPATKVWIGGGVILLGFLTFVGLGSTVPGALAGFAVTAVGVLVLVAGLTEQR